MGFIRLSDAAAMLSIHPQTLQEWIKRGYGCPPHYVYPSGYFMFKKEEVLEWQEQQRRVPTQLPANGDARRTVRDVEAAAYFNKTAREHAYLQAMRRGEVVLEVEEPDGEEGGDSSAATPDSESAAGDSGPDSSGSAVSSNDEHHGRSVPQAARKRRK